MDSLEIGLAAVSVVIGIVIYLFEVLFRQGGQDPHRGKFALLVGLIVAILSQTLVVRYVQIRKISDVIDGLQQQEMKLRTDAVADAKNSGLPLFQRVLGDRLARDHEVLVDASQGRFIIQPSELEDYGIDLFKNESNTTILATSYVKPDQWWTTTWGQQYLRENFDAVKRGVKIERIYIFADEAEFAANRALLDLQKKNGISILYLYSSQVKTEFKDDIIIVGEKLCGVLELKDRIMVRVVFDTNKPIVDETKRKYEQVKAAAKPF